ncbi:hypothetical protein M422DRAFT_46846 [Sphaerobolus stellatus SS14]|uniref:Uncharacterized protein n=1 Tax=Sphaerobolus stellatus (strain SS14) TaxID=990650 RepID=A0A0C9W1P2_SPHS4|nr:hypothetical protein M422DRAFT_46846 [Sphaerobolus stellatus SS14]
MWGELSRCPSLQRNGMHTKAFPLMSALCGKGRKQVYLRRSTEHQWPSSTLPIKITSNVADDFTYPPPYLRYCTVQPLTETDIVQFLKYRPGVAIPSSLRVFTSNIHCRDLNMRIYEDINNKLRLRARITQRESEIIAKAAELLVKDDSDQNELLQL